MLICESGTIYYLIRCTISKNKRGTNVARNQQKQTWYEYDVLLHQLFVGCGGFSYITGCSRFQHVQLVDAISNRQQHTLENRVFLELHILLRGPILATKVKAFLGLFFKLLWVNFLSLFGLSTTNRPKLPKPNYSTSI